MKKYLYGVSSANSKVLYYLAEQDIALNSHVIIDNPAIGLTVGLIESKKPAPESDAAFPMILRVATNEDLKHHERTIQRGKEAQLYVAKAALRHNLDMKIIQTTFALDNSKLLVVYSAEERVDFRELVKELAREFKTRIEMKQIGTRDRAQFIGGIGVCGLRLCCNSFMHSFDVISINMAKNQLLSLNIPKLSGQCGKLICCLKYEDENYVELRKEFPGMGERIIINREEHRITGMNLLSRMITLYNGTTYTNLTIEEYNKAKAASARDRERAGYEPRENNNYNKNRPANNTQNNSNNNGQRPQNNNHNRNNFSKNRGKNDIKK